jgi:hypothetical protein
MGFISNPRLKSGVKQTAFKYWALALKSIILLKKLPNCGYKNILGFVYFQADTLSMHSQGCCKEDIW